MISDAFIDRAGDGDTAEGAGTEGTATEDANENPVMTMAAIRVRSLFIIETG